MTSFDFSTLNSTDFEELVCDLLNSIKKNKELEISFRTFKEGKDKGIDFLYSTSEKEYNIVGQAKHYYRSGYPALINTLTSEILKVKKLNPNKYILATSLDLSHQNIVDIKSKFQPYIKDLNDVFGKKDLNRILEENSYLLERHFKLWFSSTNVLNKLLRYNIEGRSSEFLENSIKKRMRIFVETDHFSTSLQKLKNNKFIILTGEPGVGKTTLAELLVYDLINKDYELCYIYDDIKEIENILKNDDSKQVFYYDDFLGHNSYEIIKSKGSEASLINVLNRISHMKNKFFILTTRTFILYSAIHESERLRRLNIKAKESIVKLDAYTPELKAQLFKNHIEESELSSDHKEILNSGYMVNFIISHRNFSPRSVEFITLNDNVLQINASEYESYVVKNFNSPNEIWRHAYEQQIGDLERWFLNTMLTFGNSVDLKSLENAFLSRLDYEVSCNNFKRPNNPFNSTFKKIESGFVIFEYNDEEDENRQLRFINPSLVDFLRDNLRTNTDEIIRMSESCYYIHQILAIYPLINKPLYLPTENLKLQIINDSNKFIKVSTFDCDRFLIALFTSYYFPESYDLVIKKLSEIHNWGFLKSNSSYVLYLNSFLVNIKEIPVLDYLKSALKLFCSDFFSSLYDFNIAFDLVKLLSDKFQINFNNDDYLPVSQKLEQLLNDKIDEEVYWLVDFSQNEDDYEEKLREIIRLKDEVVSFGFNIEIDLSPFYDKDWNEIANYNYYKEQMEKDD